jgi:L-asparagine transporter-like permease
MGYGWASALVNGIIIIATLSVMIGSYYGCMQILVSLSEAKEAPHFLKSKTSRGTYRYSWLATGLAALIIVLLAFVLGTKLFNYLISSSSYFTFFNWIINLITYIVWLGKRDKNEIYDSPLINGMLAAIITIVVIIALMVVSLGVSDFRIGFYMAFGITVIVSAMYKILRLDLEK